MKRPFIVPVAMLVWLASLSVAHAELQTVTLTVENMHCAMCPLTVRKAIERVDGVESVEVDYDSKEAVVTYEDETTNWEFAAEASTNAGYPAHLKINE